MGYGGSGGSGGSGGPSISGVGYQNEITEQQQIEETDSNSMTIDEMRLLHQTALTQAEAKRTELRLVLASRYRELVGSSDEVIHMNDRAEELHDLVVVLPDLVSEVCYAADNVSSGAVVDVNNGGAGIGEGSSSRKLFSDSSTQSQQNNNEADQEIITNENDISVIRTELSRLSRLIHQNLDVNNVHGAAANLIALFDIISSCQQSDENSSTSEKVPYPLATALSSNNKTVGCCNIPKSIKNNPLLEVQMKMIYLHVQTLPSRTVKLARRTLLKSAAGVSLPNGGAQVTAAALSALDLLDIHPSRTSNNNEESTRATKLIDLYYESKAKLLTKLLNKLTLPSTSSGGASSTTVDATSVTNRAEIILSKIVMILQYDVILYPYQIFVLRKFGSESDESIMSTLPKFDPHLLKSKASRFLAAHLPLIRTKVKSVLMIIAGTTASKLGQIRQTLYDKTDGHECRAALDSSGVCTWDDAVSGLVDVRVVSHGTSTTFATSSNDEGRGKTTMNGSSSSSATTRRFSLWGALFSNTFSSLVHSLLTSSFHSVHVRVVSTLRTSLARAPPYTVMLPHEAHRNALRIASDLDVSLRRVSDDAHELLVHAEEREESERRLRQSLYVQTCEIMGRLLNELRRMLVMVGSKERGSSSSMEAEKKQQEDATKVLIIGRLCHLLKFRLKSLPTLLDPKSSPAVMLAAGLGVGGGKSHSGMITLMELSSSFELADDDDDGLISFDEAMEAMESAFSGTHFHGAEMVRDTLLLASSSSPGGSGVRDGSSSSGVVSNGSYASSSNTKSTPQNVTLSELALLSARGLRHAPSGNESALGTVQSSLDNIVTRCFKDWASAALTPPLKSFTTTLQESMTVASSVSDMEWRRLHGLIDKEDDALLKDINDSKGDTSTVLASSSTDTVGEVSPHVVAYLQAVAGVLNRSVCPADSLPPVPSLEYAEALGITSLDDAKDETDIPNMLVTIRGSLLGEALESVSHSLKQGILSTSTEEDTSSGSDDQEVLKRCPPSSLVQLSMDVKFIHRCFFDRNQHGFLVSSNVVNYSREIMDDLLDHLIKSAGNNTLREGSPTNGAIYERHSQVFTSCDLFLSSLFGEDIDEKFSSSDATTSSSALLSSQSFMLNPLPSSRRFILLPIQAEKSLTELQLRGKYGKKNKEDKANKDAASSNALGFGFLSSMLSTKNR